MVPVNGELIEFDDLTPEQQAAVEATFVRVLQEATNQLYGVKKGATA